MVIERQHRVGANDLDQNRIRQRMIFCKLANFNDRATIRKQGRRLKDINYTENCSHMSSHMRSSSAGANCFQSYVRRSGRSESMACSRQPVRQRHSSSTEVTVVGEWT
ncbi:hypothetical protein DPMN_094885 [Dreissena polymorpha]|uniref:Uncharacterized protein n=1 Tax=Dreissena polymorpha TaxID=45954 RepID=A0A9D4L6X1_DREPO|nr:hypothetical protein DPMN_094885 [Dreissena polymorpha]